MSKVRVVGLLLLALAMPLQAQKDKKPARKKGLEVVDAEKLQPGQVVGQVVQAAETGLKLRVEYQHLELKNPKARPNTQGNAQLRNLLRQQQELVQARQRIARARNQREAYQAMQNYQRESAQVQRALQQYLLAAQGGPRQNPFKVVTETKELTVDLSGTVEFRVSNPAFLSNQAFDDMGNLKKLTPEELKELKGKGNLPGYKASAADVKPGAKVSLTLARDKEAENRLRGTLVLVLEPGNEPIKGGKKPKK